MPRRRAGRRRAVRTGQPWVFLLVWLVWLYIQPRQPGDAGRVRRFRAALADRQARPETSGRGRHLLVALVVCTTIPTKPGGRPMAARSVLLSGVLLVGAACSSVPRPPPALAQNREEIGRAS